MADVSYIPMYRGETYTAVVDFTDNLLSGATITGATATITTALGGTSGTVGSPVVVSPRVYVPITMGANAALHPDVHIVTVTPTIDNPGTIPDETGKHRIEVTVRF